MFPNYKQQMLILSNGFFLSSLKVLLKKNKDNKHQSLFLPTRSASYFPIVICPNGCYCSQSSIIIVLKNKNVFLSERLYLTQNKEVQIYQNILFSLFDSVSSWYIGAKLKHFIRIKFEIIKVD